MTMLRLAELQLIDFVLVDSNGSEMVGLGVGFTVEISKNGGDFATGAGVKDEIGSGWYSYQLTAAETDTDGPLAVKVSAAGAAQQNLIYQVSGSFWDISGGPHILSTAEAAAFLKCDEDDPSMVLLLPQIDAYIKRGTGRNWAAEVIIPEEAKTIARELLIQWHSDPGMLIGSQVAVLTASLQACMSQLRAMALYYHIFQGLAGVGSIPIDGLSMGDTVIKLVGKVGISGDQAEKFENVITWDGYLLQTANQDLSYKYFEAYILPPGEMP